MVTSRSRAQRRPADERREDIIRAALRVFAAASYRSAGTVEIAREAGVGEPTLYRYFDDKRALYLDVLERCRDHVLDEWRRVAASQASPRQAIAAIGAWYFHNVREEPEPLRVRARAVAESQEHDTQTLLREAYLGVFDFVRGLFAAAQRQGLVGEGVNVDAAAWLFMGVGQVIDLLSLLGLEERLDDQLLSDIDRFFDRALEAQRPL